MMLRVLLVLLLTPTVAIGQMQPGAPVREHTSARALRVTIDNDLFAMRAGKPDDHDYTHGTRVLVSSAAVPGWLGRLAGDAPACLGAETRRVDCVAGSLEIAQEIYTPRIDGLQPVPGERPYSGWLFMAPGLHHVAGGRVRSIRLLVGVTGPASLAEQAQDGIHALFGEHERRGWPNQLRSELGLAIAYDDRFGLERSLGGEGVGALSLGWGAVVGNVRTGLQFDALARLGLRGELPWSPDELEGRTPMRVYAIGGVRQELVMRDLFVDGNTFHQSVQADRIPLVHEVVLGIGVRGRDFGFEYRWVQRGREYEAQPRPHAWGSIAFVFHRR